MSIYQKISCIQQEMLKEQFSTKKGFHGAYIPLPEMLGKVVPACGKHGLTMYFDAEMAMLTLNIVDLEDNRSFISQVRLPELTKDEKDEGKKLTYLKRYLLMNVFLIMEDSVDPDDVPDENSETEKQSTEEVAETVKDEKPKRVPFDDNAPDIVKKAIKELQSEDVEDMEITRQKVYAKISFRNLEADVKNEISKYYKELNKGAK